MSKKPELHFDYDEIQFEAHQRAFTIAKVTQIDLLNDIQKSLEDAFVEGQSYSEWVKELKPTLEKAGWLGKNVEVTNPKTGEKKMIEVGASRLKKIFYTNARTAYAQSEARAGYKLPLSQFIRYVAILDNRTRAEHRALHGKIAHRDDAFWKRNYPPNGWNCRCSVEFISKDEMDEQGWSEMSEAEKRLNFAQKDWDYDTRNLSANDENLLLIIKNKIEKYAKNPPAREALENIRERVKEGRRAWEATRELQKAKKQTILPLCKVPDDLKEFFKNKAENFEMGANELQKHLDKHKDITLFDYALAPFLLNDSKLEIWQDEKPRNPNKYLFINKLGSWYRMSIKNLSEKNEFLFESLIKSSDKNTLTSNKVKVWERK